MKTSLLLLFPALTGLAAAPTVQKIAFGPEEGTTVTKTFETTLDLALDDLMVSFNGQDMDPAMMGMDMSMATMTGTVMVEVEDEYGPTKDGRPTTLTRRFETLMGEVEAGSGENESGNDDDLEGVTLTFTWNEEEGKYDLSADDENLDLDEISHGGEDMDLRALLPKGEVEVDDSWQVGGNDLLGVVVPGVDWVKVQAKMEKEMAENEVPFDVDELFGDLMKKMEVTCTYEGTREEDGITLQVIDLSGELEHSMDVGEAILEVIRAEAPAEFDMSLDATVELAGELSGALLWDNAAGHFRECTMDLELAVMVSADVEADVQGNPMAGSGEMEASGVLRRRATAK